jgi:predicted TIM-barrel fold metal-dependent hydrolase
MALDFPIVDAHVHLWDLQGAIRYAWLTPPFSDAGVAGSVEPIAKTYTLDDYLADADGFQVAKIVHVDAGADPADALAETQWLETMAQARGMPDAIIAFTALNQPDADAVLAAQAAHPKVRGIRQILNWHRDPNLTYTPADLLDDQAFEAGYGRLRHYGLRFDCQIYPGQMQAAAALAGRHPDTPMILNHAGMPVDRSADGLALWRAGLKALAKRPNVAVKISGLGIVDHGWTVETIRPLVLETIDIFGADRAMFASDFPTDKLYGGFKDHLNAYDQITAAFSDNERRQLFADNADRIYGL